jgi:MerR family mercuric resistance operon transcriptional regulator
MAQIEELLGLVDAHGYTCSEERALTLTHAEMVKRKISDLKRLEKTLRSISSQCIGKKVPECPIIDALMDPADQLAIARGCQH